MSTGSGEPDDNIYYHIQKHLKLAKCLYCGNALGDTPREIQGRTRKESWESNIERHLKSCDCCGWWCFTETVHTIIDEEGGEDNIRLGLIESIVKKFNFTSDTPIHTIREHILQKPNAIFHTSPYQFERLVESVYKDFFNCETRHVGGPGDNGIDIYAVISDQPHLIQVKRREFPGYIEPVATVREFIGSLVSEDCRHGHIVTTAKRFSKPAQDLINNENLGRHKISISLKSLNDLYSMMNIQKSNITEVMNFLLDSSNFEWEHDHYAI